MKLSKKIWVDFAILIITIPIVMVVFGTDLPLILPLLFLFIIQILFDNKYPKYKHQSQMVVYVAMIALMMFATPYMHNILQKHSKQICGTLIKNEYQFSHRSLLNSPSVIVEVNGEKIEFRSKNTDLPLNSQVCVDYVESDDSIWFFHDYVLSIKQS